MDEIRVELLEQPMVLSFGGGFFRRCKEQTRDTVPFIQHLIQDFLRQEEIADYVLHEVRFGEEVVVVDDLHEMSYIIQVTQTHLYISTFVSEWGTGERLRARAQRYQLRREPDRKIAKGKVMAQ